MQASWRRAQGPARDLWHEAREFGQGQFEGNGLYYKNLPPGHGVERFKKLAHGRLFFDIPVEDFFSEACDENGDPVLIDTIAPPRLVPVLDAILGGDVRLLTVQARTVPPEVEGGYTSWHRGIPTLFVSLAASSVQVNHCRHASADMASTPHQWPFPTNRRVKAFVYMFDVAADQGCTSVVRGSHRIPWGPGGVYDLSSAGFRGFTGSGRQADGRPCVV